MKIAHPDPAFRDAAEEACRSIGTMVEKYALFNILKFVSAFHNYLPDVWTSAPYISKQPGEFKNLRILGIEIYVTERCSDWGKLVCPVNLCCSDQ